MAVPTIPSHPTPANLRDSRRTDGRAGDDDMAIGGKVRWYDGRYCILFISLLIRRVWFEARISRIVLFWNEWVGAGAMITVPLMA